MTMAANTASDPYVQGIRRGIRDHDVRHLFDIALGQGWTARRNGEGHIILEKWDRRVKISGSVRGKAGRSLANMRATLRRAGLDLGDRPSRTEQEHTMTRKPTPELIKDWERIRWAEHLNQEELAKRVGVSPSTLAKHLPLTTEEQKALRHTDQSLVHEFVDSGKTTPVLGAGKVERQMPLCGYVDDKGETCGKFKNAPRHRVLKNGVAAQPLPAPLGDVPATVAERIPEQLVERAAEIEHMDQEAIEKSALCDLPAHAHMNPHIHLGDRFPSTGDDGDAETEAALLAFGHRRPEPVMDERPIAQVAAEAAARTGDYPMITKLVARQREYQLMMKRAEVIGDDDLQLMLMEKLKLSPLETEIISLWESTRRTN